MINILVVDDDKNIRRLMKAVLEREGYTVVLAENGEEAMKQMESEHIDLCVLDVMMPKMNGYEATKAIRSMENLRKAKIPIIAMTANAFDEDRRKALEAGMNDHVTKPISIADLSKAIYKVLR